MEGDNLLERLESAVAYQEWAQKNYKPVQFPNIDSKKLLSIAKVEVIDVNSIIPDERGFMFDSGLMSRNLYSEHLDEKDNFKTPYHENLENALKLYLPEEKIPEAAKILKELGHQIYPAPGFLLVKYGHGVWANQQQEKKMKRREARCELTQTIDIGPYLRKLMFLYPNVNELLDNLKTIEGKEIPEDSLLPKHSLLRVYQIGHPLEHPVPPSTSVFDVYSKEFSGIDDLLENHADSIPLIYRTQGLITHILLPSLIERDELINDSSSFHSHLPLARITQKLPK